MRRLFTDIIRLIRNRNSYCLIYKEKNQKLISVSHTANPPETNSMLCETVLLLNAMPEYVAKQSNESAEPKPASSQ